ncbi:LOW QUALITY PROTEIN: cleavage and polyadenylation specificity factor subunit 4-like [Ctenodactylus gundi]
MHSHYTNIKFIYMYNRDSDQIIIGLWAAGRRVAGSRGVRVARGLKKAGLPPLPCKKSSPVWTVDRIKFDLEIAVEQQVGVQPGQGGAAAVCEIFLKAACGSGGKECPFLPFDPESEMKDRPPTASASVVLCADTADTGRVICVNYLVEFRPQGPLCKFMHPRFELPVGTTEPRPLPQQTQPPTEQRTPQVLLGVMQSQNSNAGSRGRPLEQVTCYKCGEKGHYANRCTKGPLAFLRAQ